MKYHYCFIFPKLINENKASRFRPVKNVHVCCLTQTRDKSQNNTVGFQADSRIVSTRLGHIQLNSN